MIIFPILCCVGSFSVKTALRGRTIATQKSLTPPHGGSQVPGLHLSVLSIPSSLDELKICQHFATIYFLVCCSCLIIRKYPTRSFISWLFLKYHGMVLSINRINLSVPK